MAFYFIQYISNIQYIIIQYFLWLMINDAIKFDIIKCLFDIIISLFREMAY